MRYLIIVITGCMLCAGSPCAYTPNDLNADTPVFLHYNESMIRALLPGYLIQRTARPAAISDARAFSLDISASGTASPSFNYPGALSEKQLPGTFRSARPMSLRSFNANATMTLAGNYMLSAHGGGMLGSTGSGRSEEHIKGGLSLWYSLLSQKFYQVGLRGGAGYLFTQGRLRETFTFDPDTAYRFNGSVLSDWRMHAMHLGMMVHKNFFIVNFYARGDCILLVGRSTSTLTGSDSQTGIIADFRTDNRPQTGIVLCSGMELLLGRFTLNAEAGREWRYGALYGSIGGSVDFRRGK